MAGVTNRGKKRLLEICFRNNVPAHFYVALFTSAIVPTSDTNTVSDMTQIAVGNGYDSGGYQLTSGSADFDFIAEDDDLNKAIIQIKNVVWVASGGNIPASGSGARYACLTDDVATVADRTIIAFWDLLADRYVSTGNGLTIQNLQIDLGE